MFFFFLATNLAILFVISITFNILFALLGIKLGGNIVMLLVIGGIFGIGGSLISLMLSKKMAKMSVGAQIIETPKTAEERWVVDTVQRQASAAGIGMPEVAIYYSPELNAFATGMDKNNALVAVSSGLLQQMTQDEAEAVLGHEVSHIANGDMVTLALIQGVVNTFVYVLAHVIGGLIDQALRGNNNEEQASSGHGLGYFVIVMIAQSVLGLFASMIVMWFSRYREFHADEGGAKLSDTRKMIAALERLQQVHTQPLPGQLNAFGISGGNSIMRLFMTHPPLEERINALRQRL